MKAGQLLGISSSALSHSMKNLETRLNLRLFNRTTRNVLLTEAGQQLFEQLLPLYQAINHEADALLNTFLNTPSRLNASIGAFHVSESMCFLPCNKCLFLKPHCFTIFWDYYIFKLVCLDKLA
nr:LysR family transcriptional regulator [uncultured Neisseria sp.]